MRQMRSVSPRSMTWSGVEPSKAGLGSLSQGPMPKRLGSGQKRISGVVFSFVRKTRPDRSSKRYTWGSPPPEFVHLPSIPPPYPLHTPLLPSRGVWNRDGTEMEGHSILNPEKSVGKGLYLPDRRPHRAFDCSIILGFGSTGETKGLAAPLSTGRSEPANVRPVFAALLCTLLFSISITCGHRSAKLIGGTEANFWRLTLAALLLGAWAYVFGIGVSGAAFPLFFVSGAVGIGIGDVAFFQTLPRLGSRLTSLLIGCMSASLAALIEWVWLGTTLSVTQMLWGLDRK